MEGGIHTNQVLIVASVIKFNSFLLMYSYVYLWSCKENVPTNNIRVHPRTLLVLIKV